METVAIFADVQNIYYTTRQAYRRQFDYRAFWESATANRRLACAYAYAIDRGDSQQQRFQQVLREIGFTVKLKPFIQRSDGSAKGDWDVGITLDMVEAAPAVDVVILVSGDGDFDLALDRIHTKYGATTEVYGVPSLTAGSLVRTATRFVPIDDAFLLSN